MLNLFSSYYFILDYEDIKNNPLIKMNKWIILLFIMNLIKLSTTNQAFI